MIDKKLSLSVIFILLIFIITSYFSQRYQDVLINYIENYNFFVGSIIYLAVTVTSTVVAPLSSLPLISIVANAWGSLTAGFLTIIGSAIGGLMAFSIAKKYGQPAVRKMVSEGDLEKIRRIIPRKPERAFGTIVFLNFILPSDILSYSLGLFSNVEKSTYFWGTLIGVTPQIMVLAYAGTLSIKYQLFILSAGVAAIIFLLRFWVRHLQS